MTAECVLAVDLGGTVVKAAVVGADGTVDGRVAVPSGEGGGQQEWMAVALDAAGQALASSTRPPAAVGLSVPGAVDPSTRQLVDLVARLRAAEPIDLAGPFERYGLPVFADNDARAALAGELRWGGHGTENLAVLTIGTGIGGAAVVDGRVPGTGLLGANQLGHLTVDLNGVECVCGNRGCAETVASARALVTAATAAGLHVDRAEAVLEAAAGGDGRAAAVVDRFLLGLVAVVVNTIHAYQPDAVVLTGGLMASAAAFLPRLQAEVARRAWTVPRGRVRVDVTTLGPAASVLGAAAVAFAGLADRAATGARS